MFLLDRIVVNGETVTRERPVCADCHRPFDATPSEIRMFRRPGTRILCRPHEEACRARARRNAELSAVAQAEWERSIG
jgi:hypothetical protein